MSIFDSVCIVASKQMKYVGLHYDKELLDRQYYSLVPYRLVVALKCEIMPPSMNESLFDAGWQRTFRERWGRLGELVEYFEFTHRPTYKKTIPRVEAFGNMFRYFVKLGWSVPEIPPPTDEVFEGYPKKKTMEAVEVRVPGYTALTTTAQAQMARIILAQQHGYATYTVTAATAATVALNTLPAAAFTLPSGIFDDINQDHIAPVEPGDIPA